LFLADAIISLLDDSLIVFFHVHLLNGVRGTVFFLFILAAILIYLLMGLTPMVPKRFFVPVALFSPVVGLAILPLLIYFYARFQWVAWAVSVCQVLVGLTIVYWLRRTRKSVLPSAGSEGRGKSDSFWPLVTERQLNSRRFSWLNLCGFLLVNLLLLLPGAIAYLFFSSSLAVGHLSQGFLALRPSGFMVQVRKYVRNDGKTIQLVPMAHVGDAGFYRALTQSFPTNSIILMEGVTDNNNLLTNKITYTRMATSLGLAEQQREFRPVAGEWVRADVDVEEFAPTTIDLLNLVMLFHSRGVSLTTVLPLLQYSPPPAVQEQIWDDLLRKRNRRVLQELNSRLPESDYFVIPWGAAHMPEISREIQNSGFRPSETNNYRVIRFGSRRK
jgi:hypothetical protein